VKFFLKKLKFNIILFKLILSANLADSKQEKAIPNPLNAANLLVRVLKKDMKQTADGISELRSQLKNINGSLSKFKIICSSFFQQVVGLWKTFQSSFLNDVIKNSLSTLFNTMISVPIGIFNDGVLTCGLSDTPSTSDIEAAVEILRPKLKGTAKFLEDYKSFLRATIKVDNSLVKNIEKNFSNFDLPFLLSNILNSTLSELNE
jgi:hypothetical protein